MSSTFPKIPAVTLDPVKIHATPPAQQSASASSPSAGTGPRPAEHHSTQAAALSPSDISYVDSLMGYVPAQAMEYILLRTGIPLPENLGQDIDTSV